MSNIKYLKTGEKVELIENLGTKGFLVQPYLTFTDNEGDEQEDLGSVVIVNNIYDKPPTEVLDAEIVRKNELLSNLLDKIHAAQSNIRNVENEVAARLKKISAYKGLERIEDWLDGKLTHCVVCSYGNSWRISEFTKEFCGASNDYERNKKLKLLTLFGTHERTAEWKLSHYSDGSGSSDDVFVFTSENEAKKFLQGIIDKGDGDFNKRMNLLKTARKYDLQYPESWAEEEKSNRIATHVKRVLEAEKQLERAKAGKDQYGQDYPS